LESGADIEEVNNLRRCFDRLKGGGLVAATKAQVLALLLSDVIGDRMDAIASGPTVASQPDPMRAQRLLQSMSTPPPAALMRRLGAGVQRSPELTEARIHNVIIGNARLAADGARLQALREGFIAEVMDTAIRGEAHAAGRMLGQRLATASRSGLRPACVIDYGESTVTLSADHGLGGRNQELALAAVEPLDGAPGCILLAMATDGEDGPGDAAGAVVTGTTASRARALRMPATAFLARHDCYRYFDALGDLLRPGSTGTNVNDLVLSIAL
jgi:hydroxypyruvate reductase